MGRFGTPDPSSGSSGADPASWNKYAYVLGDPMNGYDPGGLDTCRLNGEEKYQAACLTLTMPTISKPTGPLYTVAEWDDMHGGSPQSKNWDKAQAKLSNANELLHKVLLGDVSSPCQGDLNSIGGLGIASFQIPYTADRTTWNDASTSSDKVYQLFAPGTDAYTYYAAHPDLTVAQQFKNSPLTKGESAVAGSALAGNIYFQSGYVNSLSVQNAAALLMHEVLHTLGAYDTQIQSALFGAGSAEVDAASDNITQKLLKDCFK
jgi:hypothetical protein